MTTAYKPYLITIAGSELPRDGAVQYELAVRLTLDRIDRSRTGRALLKAMQRTGKSLLIEPWTGKDVNATTSAIDERKANASGEAILYGLPARDGPKRFQPVTEGWFIKDVAEGTGEGSDVEIRFTPAMFGFGGTAATHPTAPIAPGAPGTTPSEVLFHEMAHAYRDMNGHKHAAPTIGGRVNYDNEEEFFAVVLSNIFITDPTTETIVRGLRADHHGFNTLAPARATSKGFLADQANRRLLAKLTAQEPGLALDLLSVPATFNPVKEYYRPTP